MKSLQKSASSMLKISRFVYDVSQSEYSPERYPISQDSKLDALSKDARKLKKGVDLLTPEQKEQNRLNDLLRTIRNGAVALRNIAKGKPLKKGYAEAMKKFNELKAHLGNDPKKFISLITDLQKSNNHRGVRRALKELGIKRGFMKPKTSHLGKHSGGKRIFQLPGSEILYQFTTDRGMIPYKPKADEVFYTPKRRRY